MPDRQLVRRRTSWPRHGWALAAVALGVVATAVPPAFAHGVGSGTGPVGAHAAAAAGAVTVPAPEAGAGATVTVSRTTGLVNQAVSVSWAGFLPSSATRLQNTGDSLDVNTENPVRVYECRGAAPTSSSDCYGSPGFRGIEATDTTEAVPEVPAFTYPGQTDPFNATPDGPANWQDNVTRADGTGQVTIQVFTKRESAALGCDATAPCSIVVVPNYGRPQGATEDLLDAPWAWARRTVVPLSFLPVESACPLSSDSLRVEGSPMAADLMATWRGRTCRLSAQAVTLDYTAIGEPQTRGDVASATTDVGLVIDPLETDAAAGRGVIYSPVSVTGLVVAFQIDDADGRPVTSMKLNARLVAKLITASYRSGADPAVIDNPVNLFHDPEFLELNPGVQWPSGAPGNHPLLLGDLSDTTLALTKWIAADPDAAAFVAGKPDPWGMKVNSNYKGVALPFAGYPLLDDQLSTTFQPIQGMDALARQLSIAQFPGALVTVEGGVNVVTKPPRQNPGAREVIGILDAASAARFLLPTASLQNASGEFVPPTQGALRAGVRHSTVNDDGVTRAVDLADKNPRVYPLTLLVSAALSTQADEESRGQMTRFLQYVAGPGQVPGDEIGRLPAGHAPLPGELVDLVKAARKTVEAGPSDEPTDQPTDEPTEEATGESAATSTPTAGSAPLPAPLPSVPSVPVEAPGAGEEPQAKPSRKPTRHASASSSPSSSATVSAAPQMAMVASQPAGDRMWALPALLALALLAMLGAPLLLWLERKGRGPQWLRR
jgi:hypothetical protein